MGSFYQRVTRRRYLVSAGPHEDTTNWMPVKIEGASHQRWGSEPRDEPVAAVSVRSRSRTMNSTMSFYAASTSESSNSSSRASSPHLTRDKPIPAREKRENAAKTLISKSSRILRSHSSKFSLSSLHTIDSDTSDRYNSGRPVMVHAVKDRHNPVEAVKREELKRTISEPYDFQHVTHTDRVFLKSMERVPKTELIGEFSALRFGQASKPQLRGIRAEALPPQKPNDSPPTSPVTDSDTEIDSGLPETPPRPAPPPKDEAQPLSPAQRIRMSRSIDSFSRPSTSSSVSMITPPRRYSSRRALQPSLTSPLHTLGAYVHVAPHPEHTYAANSAGDLCKNCISVDIVDDKPLPGLPPIHAITTNDDSARQLRTAPLPRAPVNLADVPEEDETKRQSTIEPQVGFHLASDSAPVDNDRVIETNTSRKSTPQEDAPVMLSNRIFVVDDWDDAIDDSWDYPSDHGAFASKCSSSMTDQVATFVDKAMTMLAGSKPIAASTSHEEKLALANSSTRELTQSSNRPSEIRLSTCDLSAPKRSSFPALLGLGIELQQDHSEGSDPCTTPTPAIVAIESEVDDQGSSLTASFDSEFSAVSGISQCSSQESIIWSIASSIIGTQRSSNSSNSLLEQLPEYLDSLKPPNDLTEALESVQGHLQEFYNEEQSRPNTSPGMQSHQRARSLATDFVFGTPADDEQRQRPASSSSKNSPQTLQGHERVSSGSRIPIPARKSSVKEQPEFGRPPTRRMRSATTIARTRHASRASYSLFPGTPSIDI
jgi:hypothetical protein